MLPQIKEVPLQREVFPQRWQTVIFRNYGLVSTDKIARTLNCSEDAVILEAERMGLSAVKYDDRWEKRGFITLIRNNWFLLDYEQLETLLGFSRARLEFVLEKEDFLYVKLGEMKPYCPKVYYSPLTQEETIKTEALAAEISQLLSEEKVICERLLNLASQYPAIGFEAANHYFYNDRNLVEKIIQTQMLEEELTAIN